MKKEYYVGAKYECVSKYYCNYKVTIQAVFDVGVFIGYNKELEDEDIQGKILNCISEYKFNTIIKFISETINVGGFAGKNNSEIYNSKSKIILNLIVLLKATNNKDKFVGLDEGDIVNSSRYLCYNLIQPNNYYDKLNSLT